jgi:hypothetical protein
MHFEAIFNNIAQLPGVVIDRNYNQNIDAANIDILVPLFVFAASCLCKRGYALVRELLPEAFLLRDNLSIVSHISPLTSKVRFNVSNISMQCEMGQ